MRYSQKICRDLDDWMGEIAHFSGHKVALKKIYDEVLTYIKKQVSDEVASKTVCQFPISGKWSRLILHSFFIHGTFSGAFSIALPGLIKAGILSASFFGVVGFPLFLPIFITLPYVIFKIREDISKKERLIRIQALILAAKYHVLVHKINELGLQNQIEELSTISDDGLPEIEQSRSIFNSTTLEVFYLIGTMLSVGAAILTAFSLGTLVGWSIVGLVCIGAGIIYAYYHHQATEKLVKQKSEVQTLSKTVKGLEKTVCQHAEFAAGSKSFNHNFFKKQKNKRNSKLAQPIPRIHSCERLSSFTDL